MIRILFIDDTHERPRSIISFLKEEDIDVIPKIVPTKQDAYNALEDEQFDLVIIDIKLPKNESTYTTEDHAGIELLNAINYQEGIIKPAFVIGVTSEKSVLQTAKTEFDQNWFPFIYWNDYNEDNRIQLLNKVKYLEEFNKTFSPVNINKVDVAMITAVDDEYRALEKLPVNWEDIYIEGDPCIYSCCEFIDDYGNKKRMLRAKLLDMGMPSASSVTTKVLTVFSPELVVMVGICGGNSSEVKLGDLIVAERTWDYGSGKYVTVDNELKFQPQPDQLYIEPDLKSKIERNKTIITELYNEWNQKENDTKHSDLHIGALPSGAAVVSNEEYLKSVLDPQYRKYLGIDMETYGVYYSCKNHNSNVKYISIKSVSDLADKDKDDSYHKYGSYLSAFFAFKLISKNII